MALGGGQKGSGYHLAILLGKKIMVLNCSMVISEWSAQFSRNEQFDTTYQKAGLTRDIYNGGCKNPFSRCLG